MLDLFSGAIKMWKIPLHCRRMSVPIPANITDIIFEAMPIQTELLLCTLISRQMLHGKWFQYIASPPGVGVGVEE